MRKILIIDADEIMAKQYAFSFEAVKYAVEIASTAEEAIEKLGAAVDYDAVLVDTELPTVGNAHIVTRLRQAESKAPVIVLSFSANKDMLIELMRRGASDFIEKPVGFGELYTRIEEDIEKNPYTQPQRSIAQ